MRLVRYDNRSGLSMSRITVLLLVMNVLCPAVAATSCTVVSLYPPRNVPFVHGDRRSYSVNPILNLLRGGDTKLEESVVDLRSQLSVMYDIQNQNDITSANDTCTEIQTTNIYGGSFKEAMLLAKQQGRLLMILIPQHPSNQKKGDAMDSAVMAAFLSTAVSQIAERAPPKKKSSKIEMAQKNGSFLLWTCTAGMASKEAALIFKRISGGTIQRTNAAGEKRPLLAVLYPHTDARGEMVPILLAQHHCTPPPDGEKLATWLQTLRQRSAKYYAALLKQQQERLWQQERVLGYQKSIQSDVELKERRIQEALEQERRKEAEAARLEQVQERRKHFLELLNHVTVSDDSNTDELGSITTVALRFGDGRTGKRRFTDQATIQNIFHWVDAEFAMECETVLLQTMNGQRSFEWPTDDDPPLKLSDVGLGKMFGLRVTTKSSGAALSEKKSDSS